MLSFDLPHSLNVSGRRALNSQIIAAVTSKITENIVSLFSHNLFIKLLAGNLHWILTWVLNIDAAHRLWVCCCRSEQPPPRLKRSCRNTCYHRDALCLQLQRRGRVIGRARRDPGAQGWPHHADAQWSLTAPQLTPMSESSLYVFMRGKDGDPGVMETECAVVINERREEEGSKCGWKDEGGAVWAHNGSLSVFNILLHWCENLSGDIHGNDGDVPFYICSEMQQILSLRELQKKIPNSPSSQREA